MNQFQSRYPWLVFTFQCFMACFIVVLKYPFLHHSVKQAAWQKGCVLRWCFHLCFYLNEWLAEANGVSTLPSAQLVTANLYAHSISESQFSCSLIWAICSNKKHQFFSRQWGTCSPHHQIWQSVTPIEIKEMFGCISVQPFPWLKE